MFHTFELFQSVLKLADPIGPNLSQIDSYRISVRVRARGGLGEHLVALEVDLTLRYAARNRRNH